MTTLYIRNVDESVARDAKRAAAVRGITLAEYVGRLVELHQRGIASRVAEIDDLLIETHLEEVSA